MDKEYKKGGLGLFTHIKSGTEYRLLNDHVRDCTNSRDGERVVLYQDDEGNMYVREYNEFFEKFKDKN